MRIPFSLAFLLLILGEITVYIQVGEAIGVPATLGLTLFGMVVGVTLLRAHGVATLMRVRAEIEAGRTPTRSIVDGAMLAVAALLIILPGFITDTLGVLLFVPAVRAAVWRALRGRMKVAVANTQKGSGAARGPVVDLDRSEYGAGPYADSPWRQGSGPDT